MEVLTRKDFNLIRPDGLALWEFVSVTSSTQIAEGQMALVNLSAASADVTVTLPAGSAKARAAVALIAVDPDGLYRLKIEADSGESIIGCPVGIKPLVAGELTELVYTGSGWLVTAGYAGGEHKLTLHGQSTNSTPTTLSMDGAAASATNQLVLLQNSAVAIKGVVEGYEDSGNRIAHYEADLILKRPGSGAAGTVILQDDFYERYENVSTMTVEASANTTLGAAKIDFTGSGSYVVDLVANLTFTEVHG